MPDIGYQMQLMQAMQDPRSPMSPLGALNQLSETVGRAWQGYEGRTDEQDAIKYFMAPGREISPESIQEFSSTHPRMPLVDVYKYAGMIATQKKARRMKDQYKIIQSAAKEAKAKGEDFDTSKIPELIPDMDADMVKMVGEYKKLYPDAKLVEMKPGEEYQWSRGGKFIGDKIKGPTKVERPYKIGQIIDVLTKEGKKAKATVLGYGVNEQPVFTDIIEEIEKPKSVTKHPKTYMTQAGGITVIDENNPIENARIEREGLVPYEKPEKPEKPEKVTIYNLKKGTEMETTKEVADALKAQGGWGDERPMFKPEEPQKPSRAPYRNIQTGGVEYFDKNDAKDREYLKREGKNYQAIAESPLAPVIRESLTTTETSGYKTADEVKAAYESKKITKEKALEILRKDFGM